MTVEEASKAFVQAANRSTTLYELSDEYLHLFELLEDPETELEELLIELDRVGGQINQKAEAIAGLITWYEGLATMRKAEAKRMADSVHRFEVQADRLRTYVLQHMKAMELPRIDTSRFTLSIRQNPPRVEIVEAMAIPHEFQREKITIEPDKVAIAKHWKATGEVVAGVDIVRTERLDIR